MLGAAPDVIPVVPPWVWVSTEIDFRRTSSAAEAVRDAAERIFGLLPPEQGRALLSLWLEFEDAETSEARFAKALDRLQPLLLNTLTDGGTWAENGVTEAQVVDRYGPVIERGSPLLWREARALVREHFQGH